MTLVMNSRKINKLQIETNYSQILLAKISYRRSAFTASVRRFLSVLLVSLSAIIGMQGAARAGDGWDVFFDDRGHVFNVFHHNDSGNNPAVDCHTRNGQSCGANWPFYFNSGLISSNADFWNTTLTSNGWVDRTNRRLWFPTHTSNNSGFACIDISDIANPNFCYGSRSSAFVALGNKPIAKAANNTNASFWPNGIGTIEAIGRKIYALESATGKLLCMDVDTKSPCTSQPYQLVTSVETFSGSVAWNGNYYWSGQFIALDGRLYGLIGTIPANDKTPPATTYAVCFDAALGTVCSGWLNKPLSTVSNNMFPLPSASGSVLGVCYTNSTSAGSSTPECFDTAGNSITDSSGFNSHLKMLDLGPGVTNTPQRSGSRLYWIDGSFLVDYVSNSEQYIRCFDFSTNSLCSGNWPITPTLVAGTIGSKTYYYSDLTYAVTIDERNCIWKNGDNTLIAAFSPDGQPQGWFLGNDSTPIAINICTAKTTCDVSNARTLSQGGWSAKRSNSPLTNTFFDGAFPTDLKIGGASASITLTTASAARSFLPNSGTPRRLIGNATDPNAATVKNTLAGQTVAAMLNVANNSGMAAAEIQSGQYAGKTVTEMIDSANKALDGGLLGSNTYSSLTVALDSINLSFEQGVSSGYLACPK